MSYTLQVNGNEVQLVGSQNERLLLFKVEQSSLESARIMASYFEVVNAYPEVVKYTYGQTTNLDIVVLSALVYRTALASENIAGLKMLEVGSWFGCSSVFNALCLKNLAPESTLFCMDTWEGSPNEHSHSIANYENALEHFRAITRYMKVSHIVKPLVCDSIVGMAALRDDYYDIIFVDAAHNYENVRQDLKNAIRLIKPGGIIVGHDCECKQEELPLAVRQRLEQEADPDTYEGYHIGVIKALDEVFGQDYDHFKPSLIWHKTCTAEDKVSLLQRIQESETKAIREIEAVMSQLKETLGSIKQWVEVGDKEQSPKQCLHAISLLETSIQGINASRGKSHIRERKNTLVKLKDHFLNLMNGITYEREYMVTKYIVEIEERL